MRQQLTPFTQMLGLAFILLSIIVCAGCTTPASPTQSTPEPTTLSPSAELTSISTQVTAEPVQTTSTKTPVTTAQLSNGITISYPADWEREDVGTTDMRDYGRSTVNVANFYSPTITPERKIKSETNPDTSTYSVLSIDVDPTPVTDFEQYFNLVTLALQQKYGSITITKHNYQMEISGYDSYKLDFDTKTGENTYLRGAYIFTDVDGTIYIFAFKNPSPYSAEVEAMWKSIKIVPTVTTTKNR